MKRERPRCPQCNKKLRNERAVMAHMRDAHSHAKQMRDLREGTRSRSNLFLAITALWLAVTAAAALVAARYWGVL